MSYVHWPVAHCGCHCPEDHRHEPTAEQGSPTTLACTCLPLNRRLMAHLLRVDEGSVHEQGCVERVAAEARQQALTDAIAAVEGMPDTVAVFYRAAVIDTLTRLRDG